MKLNPPSAHRSQIKICEKRQMRNVQFRFMQNAFRILKPIQKSSKRVWVFRNTGANAFAKNQTRLAYEDKRDLYCTLNVFKNKSVDQTRYIIYGVIRKEPIIHYSQINKIKVNDLQKANWQSTSIYNPSIQSPFTVEINILHLNYLINTTIKRFLFKCGYVNGIVMQLYGHWYMICIYFVIIIIKGNYNNTNMNF